MSESVQALYAAILTALAHATGLFGTDLATIARDPRVDPAVNGGHCYTELVDGIPPATWRGLIRSLRVLCASAAFERQVGVST